MKPEAILAAAVELIQQIESDIRPANEIINIYTRSRRYIGSKDRRNLTDLVWRYVRYRSRLDYLYPQASALEKLIALQKDAVPAIIPDAPDFINWEVPSWLPSLIPNAVSELPALLKTAPIVLRANGPRDKVHQLLADEGLETEPTKLSPYGLILTHRTNIQNTLAYQTGQVEIQDEGSQCVALETGIKADDTILDYCAGAGGKSLIFAQMMSNQGKIVAHDISDRSLSELKKRAIRAGAFCIQVQRPVQDALFDHVVTDVPCSGTGTWRRCPDMRWKLTEQQLQVLLQTQSDILDTACRYVKPNGKLSYMTCSLTDLENTVQIQKFIQRHPDFSLIRKRQFSPALTGTDGLFIATLKRSE